MYINTKLSLRRKAGAHVLKYLEGIPTPTKLIDHLAGADLSSSPHVEFFTTVPRFVNYNVEQRLSKLFLHHVLYPAGGARMPYQPVVIRNGRLVRVSSTYKLHVSKNTCAFKFNETDFVHITRESNVEVQNKTTKEQLNIVNNASKVSPTRRSSENTNTVFGKVFSSPLDVVEDNVSNNNSVNSNEYCSDGSANTTFCRSRWSNKNNKSDSENCTTVKVTENAQDRCEKFTSSPVSAHVPWSRYDVARHPFFVSPRLSKSTAFYRDPGVRIGRYTMAEPLFKIYKTNKFTRSVIPLQQYSAHERNSLQSTYTNQSSTTTNIHDKNNNNRYKKGEYAFDIIGGTSDHEENIQEVNQSSDRQRGVCDSVFAPLCTVINEYFNEKCVPVLLELKERLAEHSVSEHVARKTNKQEQLVKRQEEQHRENKMEDNRRHERSDRKMKHSFSEVEQSIANLLVNPSGGVLCARINSESGKAELVESHCYVNKRHNFKEENVKVEASNGNIVATTSYTTNDNYDNIKGIVENNMETLRFIIVEYVKHALHQKKYSEVKQELKKKKNKNSSNIHTYCHVMTLLPPRAVVAIPMISSCPRTESTINKSINTLTGNCNHNIQQYVKKQHEEFICRLAGGVEPHVPFAVGRAKGCRVKTSAVNLNDAKSKLFAHINCLLRINVNATASMSNVNNDEEQERENNFTSNRFHHHYDHNHTTLTEPNELEKHYQNKNSSSRTEEKCSFEPWRLGVSLDPLLPYQIRTVYEEDNLASSNNNNDGNFNSSISGLNVDTHKEVTEDESRASLEQGEQEAIPLPLMLGRCDAETYLIPQHELIVTLYVPPQTQKMCKEQNVDRLRLQAELGHVPRSFLALNKTYRNEMERKNNGDENTNDDVAWSSHAKLTASRLAKGRLANIECAENDCNNSNLVEPNENAHLSEGSVTGNNKQSVSCANVLEKFTSHKVRVLPGDVLYIPRNWGYRVHRIVGSAVYGVDESLNKIMKPQVFSNTSISWLHRSCHSDEYTSNLSDHGHTIVRDRELSSGTPTQQSTTDVNINNNTKENWNFAVSSIDVDAFCISYQPYPQLTKEQASVYIAANYVTRGIDEFYDHGGNAVYHKYE